MRQKIASLLHTASRMVVIVVIICVTAVLLKWNQRRLAGRQNPA